jgi:hypothetical protein
MYLYLYIILAVMVINGNNILKRNLWVARFEGDRIRLSTEIVENDQLPWLAGEEPVECGLLVVTPGRYRLVPHPTGTPSDDLVRILRQIEETAAQGEVLDRTQNNARDGIPGRLIPCNVSPRGPGWRINFPKEATELVPPEEQHSLVYLMIVAGFIEIWFLDTLRRALSRPISEVLP